mmetsp:Transcript_6546/g.23540  ORF Transcript_6546/g.23540 Transcript_6546/m.23540 type:complete len:432 (+) Transcript_6546:156-1451(+)
MMVVDDLVEEPDVNLASAVIDGLAHKLVWGVQQVVGLREPQQGALRPDLLPEELHGGDGAPHLEKEGWLLERVLQDLLCDDRAGGVEAHGVRLGLVKASTGEGELGVVRRDLGDVVPDQLLNLAGLLVRDQPAGDLHARLLWNDGLHAIPLEPPPQAGDLESRPHGGALVGSESALAGEGSDPVLAHPLLEELVRKLRVVLLLLRHKRDVIVESGNVDFTVRVVKAGDHVGDHVEGVGRRAAECSAVHVAVRRLHLHLHRREAPERGDDSGLLLRELAAVRGEAKVGGKPVLVLALAQKVLQVGRPDLLLTLQQVLHVHGELTSRGLQDSLRGLDAEQDARLIVARAAALDPTVPRPGLEGLVIPQLEGVRWLHVVVRVDQHGGGALSVDVITIHYGLSTCLKDFDVLQASLSAPPRDPICGLPHVALVLR